MRRRTIYLTLALLGTAVILLIVVLKNNKANASVSAAIPRNLFPFNQGLFWGYINEKGNVIVKPKYLSAMDFSEGLAAVREKGTYGYIDENGKYEIEPKFDFAESFNNGIARVYIDGVPFFIDKKGKTLFKHSFSDIEPYSDRTYTVARTSSGRSCLIDLGGKMITDTIFSKIDLSNEGPVVVYMYDKAKDDTLYDLVNWHACGVMDSTGKWLVKTGIYKKIAPYRGGMAIADLMVKYPCTRKTNRYCVLNSSGQQVYIVPQSKWHFDYDYEGYSDGLAMVEIYTVDPDSTKNWFAAPRLHGAVDTSGNIVFSFDNVISVTPFSCNRAFVQRSNHEWQLIGRDGKNIVNDRFQGTVRRYGEETPLFVDGKTFVLTTSGWSQMDTLGKKIKDAPKGFYSETSVTRAGNILIGGSNSNTQQLWNTDDTTDLSSSAFSWINTSTATDKLIRVGLADDNWGYIDHKGNVVWKEMKMNNDFADLNIDYMCRGYFMASSPYRSELSGYGGWGGSDNDFIQVPQKTVLNQNELQVVIDPNDTARWETFYNGCSVYVSNATATNYYFPAENSRLDMILQAKNKNGTWKDIEYLPHSWCGNSYHTLYLPPDSAWKFSMPLYHGTYQTKIRAMLLYQRDPKQKNEDTLYSNEIEGSVNPAQFWRKREYYPSGIMDSYDE